MGLFRVPVDDLHASGVSFLVENNFLLPLAFLFAALTVFFIYRRGKGIAVPLCAALTAALTVGVVGLEHYWSAECPVERERFESTLRIFQQNTAFFRAQSDSWRASHPAIVADGTLLAFVRKYTELMRWDQDTDYYLVYDEEEDPGAKKLLAQLQSFHGPPYSAVYHPERKQVQVKHPSGGHGDIWLWVPRTINGVECLYNPDFTYGDFAIPNCNRKEWVLPIQEKPWLLGGKQLTVPVPNDTHKFLVNLFGPNYMKPYRNRLQCAENIFTNASRWWLFGYGTLMAIAGVTAYRYFAGWNGFKTVAPLSDIRAE